MKGIFEILTAQEWKNIQSEKWQQNSIEKYTFSNKFYKHLEKV